MPTSVKSLSDDLTFIGKDTREIAMSFLEKTGGPTSLGVWLCLKYGDDVSACSHDIDPTAYTDASTFRSDYLAAKLLSKFKSGVKTQDLRRRKAAEAKFRACEVHLQTVRSTLYEAIRSNAVLRDILYLAKEKIASILGEIDTAHYVDLCSFGPGSSTSIPRRKAHPSNKYLSADVTASASTFVSWFFQDAGFPRPKFNLVEYSRVEFVPKNFKSDRIIAVEPDWNIFFQKGAGKMIRKCLRKVGIDLDRQSEFHGWLSRLASLDGSHATLDLTSASDTVATCLLRFLLPDKWFIFLNSLRTNCVKLGDEMIYVRKFSSMGNGFTFELESLVFYALAYATAAKTGTRGSVSVFGDDIIIPTGAVKQFEIVLQQCGFILNPEKSYSTGLFRESCGYHFFDGWDCKPLYIKNELNHDSERFKFCNALRRLTHRLHATDVLSHAYRDTYTRCVRSIRRKFYIPDGYGDGGLVSYFDEVTPAKSRRKNASITKYASGIEGYRVRCLQPIRVVGDVMHGGLLIHRLRQAVRSKKSIWHQGGTPIFRVPLSDLRRVDFLPEIGNSLSFSQSNVKYRVGLMHVQRWFDPGEI